MQKDYKRRIDAARKAEIADMAEGQTSDQARRQAVHRPYCCDMIRHQGEQIKHRPTFRDLVDRIQEGVQSGRFMMNDPVPDDFLKDGHIDVAEYIADKYDIRGDADGQRKETDRE